MAEVIKLNRNVMAVNTYIVYNEETKKGVVIDPSFNPQVVIDCINEEDIEIEAILLTHGHFDHIAGVDAVRKQFGVPVYIHADDADMLFSAEKNHSSMAGARIETDPAEHTFKSGDMLEFAGMKFGVLGTPGHTMGSVCFLTDDMMFAGDTLFYMSIGRTDLGGSDPRKMQESLEILRKIPEDLIVHPGHGQSSSLAFEKDNNPFLMTW